MISGSVPEPMEQAALKTGTTVSSVLMQCYSALYYEDSLIYPGYLSILDSLTLAIRISSYITLFIDWLS